MSENQNKRNKMSTDIEALEQARTTGSNGKDTFEIQPTRTRTIVLWVLVLTSVVGVALGLSLGLNQRSNTQAQLTLTPTAPSSSFPTVASSIIPTTAAPYYAPVTSSAPSPHPTTGSPFTNTPTISPTTETLDPTPQLTINPTNGPTSATSSNKQLWWILEARPLETDLENLKNRTVELKALDLSGDGKVLALAFRHMIRLYRHVDGQWVPAAADIGTGVHHYRDVALNYDGTIVAASSVPRNETVEVFQYTSGYNSYTSMGAPITYGGGSSFRQFGLSLDLSGNGLRLAIAAPNVDDPSINIGLVRVYEWDKISQEWLILGHDIIGRSMAANFGTSLAISREGTTIVTGAVWANGPMGRFQGYTQVLKFNETSNEWERLGTDIDGEAADDMSGRSVAISDDGSIVATSAKGANSGEDCYESGHVRVYKYETNSLGGPVWVQIGHDIDGTSCYEFSGDAIALSGDGTTIAIGSADRDKVRTYRNVEASEWELIGPELVGRFQSQGLFGRALALSGDGSTLVAGGREVSSSRIYSLEYI